jgi:hypothetical protein
MALDEEKENETMHHEANFATPLGARKLLVSDGLLMRSDPASVTELAAITEVDESDVELKVHIGPEGDGEEEKEEKKEEEGTVVPENISLADMYKMTLKLQKQNMEQFNMLQRQMHALTTATRGRSSGLSAMKVNRHR